MYCVPEEATGFPAFKRKGENGMFIAYILLAVVVLMLLAPGARWLKCRMQCKRQLMAFCREHVYTLHTRRKAWHLGTRHGNQADFAIETDGDVYAVKLFGVAHKRAMLILFMDGKYSIRRFIGLSLQVRFTFDTKPAAMPAYDFDWPEISAEKKRHHVLLLQPEPMNILSQNREGKEAHFHGEEQWQEMDILTMREMQGLIQ